MEIALVSKGLLADNQGILGQEDVLPRIVLGLREQLFHGELVDSACTPVVSLKQEFWVVLHGFGELLDQRLAETLLLCSHLLFFMEELLCHLVLVVAVN